ncbi:MAG: hypothetical protein A2144_09325 [Chloroflexi bacterium RBG_16_50_9]|nr:MAG: hypothetical protein A2144_09325 [Chloroflexi bacterium RBG_16_50_9]
METAIVSLICIALVIFGGMTMSQGFMTSVDASTSRLEEVGHRNDIIMRTDLSSIGTSMSANNTMEVTLENSGQTKLADFDKWDLIVQYYDSAGNYYTRWLPHAEGVLGDNEWEVVWIRLNGAAEVFEPNVLNPQEQIKIRAQLSPAAGAGTTNMVVVATPNGVSASSYFSP